MGEIVISLCDRTGNMVKPWADAGYECICVDLQNKMYESNGNIIKIRRDLTRIKDLSELTAGASVVAIFAFPPCTDLAVSGARHFQRKGLKAVVEALALVERCVDLCEQSGAPWMLENPVSVISTHWRKADYSFDPYQYAGYLEDPSTDTYTKKTCLWTGGGFVMPAVKPVNISHAPGKSPIHLAPPSKDRANIRSVTPMGFARAVFEANCPLAPTPAGLGDHRKGEME